MSNSKASIPKDKLAWVHGLRKEPIPPILRRIVLRGVLISTSAIVLTWLASNIPGTNWHEKGLVAYTLPVGIPPIVILVHHTVVTFACPGKFWRVYCELLVLTAEVVGIIIYKIRLVHFKIDSFLTTDLTYFADFGGSYLLLFSLIAAWVFLLWDVVIHKNTTLGQKHDIYPDAPKLCPEGWKLRLGLIFGNNAFKERLKAEGPKTKMIRGVLACLFLIAVFLSAFYYLIAKPIQQTSYINLKSILMPPEFLNIPLIPPITIVTLFKIPSEVGGIDEIRDPLASVLNLALIGRESLDLSPGSECGSPVAAEYNPQNLLFSTTYTVTQTCMNARDIAVFQDDMEGISAYLPDLLITVDYTKLPGFNISDTSLSTARFRNVLTFVGFTDSMTDVLANTSPVPLQPGSHLYGTPSVSLRQKVTNSAALVAIGISKISDPFVIANMQALLPDTSPSIPSGNTTATLRVLQPRIDPGEWKIEKDDIESSVFSGFSLVGGFWASLNAIFGILFGSTMKLVLFGIKPLSIYGLVHLFHKGRKFSFEDNLNAKDRDETVALLRAHLLDMELRDPATNRASLMPKLKDERALPFHRRDSEVLSVGKSDHSEEVEAAPR